MFKSPKTLYTIRITLLPSNILYKEYQTHRPDFYLLKQQLQRLNKGKTLKIQAKISGTIEILGKEYDIAQKPGDKMIACLLMEASYKAYTSFCRTFENSKLLDSSPFEMTLEGEL
ncbi:hypothetical protein [Saccharibacillus qingshengii]|uniref:hypothetical protein n=1 Tax=Saccharibacillus qingshengii TaxID=1763540 RepID=UPI001557257C|nr:hypothetical protein [Saccharibacillus qingshengii]